MYNVPTLQIQGPYNNCPGKEQIEADIAKHDLKPFIEYVDDRGSWQNDRDTMVFALHGERLQALILAQLVHEWMVDEFHFKKSEGKTIVRLWWD